MFETRESASGMIVGKIHESSNIGTNTRREPELPQCVGLLDERLQQLAEVVAALGVRLEPLCHADTPHGVEPEKESGTSAPLVVWLREKSRVIQLQTERLTNLLQRLEV